MSREWLRQFAKRVLNPVVRHWAGTPWSPLALVYHTGRRSGRPYTTPLEVGRLGSDFVIALTHGPTTDWYQNLVAANGGTLRWRGHTYTIGRPTIITLAEALPAFPPFERPLIRLLGLTQFVRMKVIASFDF